MGRPRSLLTRVEVDVVKHAHNCQANARHRLQRGDRRLKVRNRRSWDHYCLACAREIVVRGKAALDALADALNSG